MLCWARPVRWPIVLGKCAKAPCRLGGALCALLQACFDGVELIA